MKIAICSSFVPFIFGGARNIVEWLEQKLQECGHQVERIYLPQIDIPELIFQQMAAYRWIDMSESADRVICFRPPAHMIPHPNKILWFIHHIRVFYDLWGSEYRPVPDTEKWRGYRQALMNADTAALHEAKKIFTNSQTVSKRLQHYNNVASEVLYPPIFNSEAFHYASQNNDVVYISRVEHHKRQHLLIEAMQYTRTPVKLKLYGVCNGENYFKTLQNLIKQPNLAERVVFEHRWITEDEKIKLLANCLAAAYIPFDEDSYGYPSLEASHASKPILTTTDSGGVVELVTNGVNGFVCEPDPKALAEALDEFYLDRKKAKCMGQAAYDRITELNIEWPYVIEKLLS